MHFRLFPFLIFACFLLLLVKVADFIQGEQIFSENLLVGSGHAEGEEKKEGGEGKKEGEKKDEKKDKKEKDKKPAIKVSETAPEKVVKDPEGPQFSASEIEVLQRLRQRREQLDAREKELEVREKVLRLTEAKIDQKLADLNKLKDQVQVILDSYDQKEEIKLQSLVKIYENMKPKEAARIFEQLDLQTLLPVIDKMKEAKVAPVLAQMDPQVAKVVTIELSRMRKLPKTVSANTNLQN